MQRRHKIYLTLVATWAAMVGSVCLRFLCAILRDRDGGVFALGLKPRPGSRYLIDISTEDFREVGGAVLVGGDENGFDGIELFTWHARSGWLLICAAGLLITALAVRRLRAKHLHQASRIER